MKMYRLAERFYSIQGEGIMAGTPMFFVRFAGCNLACPWCDTDHTERDQRTAGQLCQDAVGCGARWACLTGGEPALQVDQALVDDLHGCGLKVAIETNGTHPLPDGLDWVTVSPKVGPSMIAVRQADEVRCVVAHGDPLPCPVTEAKFYLISPLFDGANLVPANLDWCVHMVKENPRWRLSVQLHKLLGFR